MVTNSEGAQATLRGDDNIRSLSQRGSAEYLTALLCGVVDYRSRVCGAPNDHEGNHNFVLRTVRED